jgi:hypothetical protein
MSLDGTSCLGKTLKIYDDPVSSKNLATAIKNEVYNLVENTRKEQGYRSKTTEFI